MKMTEQGKRNLDSVIAVVTLLAAAAGGLFAAYQYLEARHETRIGRSLEYVKRSNEDRIDRAVATLNAWSRSEYPELLRAKLIRDDRQRNDELGRIVTKSRERAYEDPSVRSSFNTLVVFYEEAAICAQTGYCDQETILKFMEPQAFGFYAEWRMLFCWGRTYRVPEGEEPPDPGFANRFARFFVRKPSLQDPCKLDLADARDHLLALTK